MITKLIFINRYRSETIKKKQQTCSVCCENKDLNEFVGPITDNCLHLNRSLCNSCIFYHVQQVFQTTIRDDIFCPEFNCTSKLDYNTVKKVILKNIYILCFLLKMVLILSLSILDIICDFVLVRKSFKTKKIKKLV